MQRLSLIIPVYNGEKYLASTIAELDAWHQIHPFHEVIFIDDGSTDNTHDTLLDIALSSNNLKLMANGHMGKTLPITILKHTKNKGKGRAIANALSKIKDTDIVGFTDVELPYGLQQIHAVIKKYKTGADVIIGQRKQNHKNYHPYRLLYTKLYQLLLPKSTREFSDTQCGFKFFRYQAAKDIFSVLQTHRWVFDIELLIAAKAQNKNIAEVPVSIKPQCKTKGSISLYKDGPQIIKDLKK